MSIDNIKKKSFSEGSPTQKICITLSQLRHLADILALLTTFHFKVNCIF